MGELKKEMTQKEMFEIQTQQTREMIEAFYHIECSYLHCENCLFGGKTKCKMVKINKIIQQINKRIWKMNVQETY